MDQSNHGRHAHVGEHETEEAARHGERVSDRMHVIGVGGDAAGCCGIWTK